MEKILVNTETLIVDDEEVSGVVLSNLLESLGTKCQTVGSKELLYDFLEKKNFDFIFLDYRLGSDCGLDILRELVKKHLFTRVFMITAYGSIDLALQSIHMGATGFITKPFGKEVEVEIRRALRIKDKETRDFFALSGNQTGIMGQSKKIRYLHEQIYKMKDVDTNVLIFGESGTGKELITRALHNTSKRSNERFEAINCAAIPGNLLEAELFGYRRGAFTDAKSDRVGLFESCSSGTLFLDEIGELPLELQGKLLRVLQEKIVTPLGARQSVKINTRVIAATNKNLKKMVAAGEFREDLYYRLSILQIESPSLRERAEDIPVLVEYFLTKISKELEKPVFSLTAEIMSKIESYNWPGNVRELKNSLERAIILSDSGLISLEHLFEHSADLEGLSDGSVGSIKELSEMKEEFEKEYLENLMEKTKGNVTNASKIAGRLRTDMYRLFAKHGIDHARFKQN